MPYNDSTNIYSYSKFIVDPNGDTPYQTIQSAIDAANVVAIASSIAQVVVIRPGNYIENLTMYPNVHLHGVSGNVDDLGIKITGTHTPPNSGICTFTHINWYGINSIFSSAAASTCYFGGETCNYFLSGAGYVFDLPNFSNMIGAVNSGDLSPWVGGTSGWVNNPTGGATIVILSCAVGEGNTHTMQISGELQCQLSDVYCPINIVGTSTDSIIEHSDISGNITFGGSTECRFSHCTIESGAAQALTQNSTGTIRVSNLMINSSNNPAIGGTGTIDLGSITFLDDDNIGGTITLTDTSVLQTSDLQLKTSLGGSARFDDGRLDSITYNQTIYVGKHGNDANTGTTPEYAKLTFGQALTLASGETPSSTNRFSIVCLDDGIYTESLTGVQYVDIYAPNAKLVGSIDVADDTHIKFRAQDIGTGVIGILKSTGSTYSFVEIDTVTCMGTAIGTLCLSGFLNYSWKTMYVENGFGIGDLSSAQLHIHLNGGDIYISGTGYGVVRANAGETVGRVDHIADIGGGNGTGIDCTAGTINLQISDMESLATAILVPAGTGTCNIQVTEIDSTVAYNVGVGGTLNLIVNEISGTETNAGTLSLIRGDGTSSMNDIVSTGLTDSSRTEDAVAVYGASGALSEIGPLTNGQLVIGSTGNPPVATTLTAGTNITINEAAGSITINSTAGSGEFIQQIYAETATVTTVNTEFGYDNTIPEQTEGIEILTVTITPTNASNYLLIAFDFNGGLGTGASNHLAAALFQDATTNAIYATKTQSAVNTIHELSGRYRMTAATTSATTFKLRASNSQFYLNGDVFGNRIYGGVSKCTITVTEIKA